MIDLKKDIEKMVDKLIAEVVNQAKVKIESEITENEPFRMHNINELKIETERKIMREKAHEAHLKTKAAKRGRPKKNVADSVSNQSVTDKQKLIRERFEKFKKEGAI